MYRRSRGGDTKTTLANTKTLEPTEKILHETQTKPKHAENREKTSQNTTERYVERKKETTKETSE